MNTTTMLVQRAGARDRALLQRLCLTDESSRSTIRFWRGVTRAGGAGVTLTASLAPLLWNGPLRLGAGRSLGLVVFSHLLVQLVKRSVGRARPAVANRQVRIADVPDRFSFPSGHAAAVMSVALGFSSAHPSWTLPLMGAAFVVGASRVMLGVHYPGDVAAGQLIALLAAALLAVFV